MNYSFGNTYHFVAIGKPERQVRKA